MATADGDGLVAPNPLAAAILDFLYEQFGQRVNIIALIDAMWTKFPESAGGYYTCTHATVAGTLVDLKAAGLVVKGETEWYRLTAKAWLTVTRSRQDCLSTSMSSQT